MVRLPHFDEIVDSFSQNPKPPKTPKTVWRIKINGQFITTISGKTVWKRIGDAKSAVHHHVSSWLCGIPYGSRDYKISSGDYMDAMIKQGILEFVELPI